MCPSYFMCMENPKRGYNWKLTWGIVCQTSDDGWFDKVSFSFDDVTTEFDWSAQFLHFGQSFEVTLWSISPTFYENLLLWFPCAKKLQSQNVNREKVRKTLVWGKAACKMLVKLKPGAQLWNARVRRGFRRQGGLPTCWWWSRKLSSDVRQLDRKPFRGQSTSSRWCICCQSEIKTWIEILKTFQCKFMIFYVNLCLKI